MKLSKIILASIVTATLTLGNFAFADGHGMKKDIVDTAVAAGSFTTLVTAVQAADLVAKLKEEGPFTVFAPNDEAFAKIPADTLNALVADKEALTGILGLHVIAGKKMAADVVGIYQATTITGRTLNIKVMGGEVYVNGSKVIATDIETSNGVIHVIDTVITK
ncbi:fasciclin domain-containing protein [Reinekea sp.]|jgi:prepilin-type processing-associated H-X9-DG protein|uniref:fasciclin domain-containing protein n=1 Tax=Reinekea sp. TaxID=1970455 RepID=UPI00398A0819